MSDIFKEFSVDVLRDSENAGPTSAEVRMAQEIARFRAENIHLRRAGMDRPSAELHEAALAELRADNERLRARVEKLERALHAAKDAMAAVSVPRDNERAILFQAYDAALVALEAKP
jgi:hypothetical protein